MRRRDSVGANPPQERIQTIVNGFRPQLESFPGPSAEEQLA
jgi:hypothetical protein